MAIISQISVALKPEFYKSTLRMGALAPGSTLTLKIVGLNGDRALIDFGNFRSTAEVKIPVCLGEELTVRVLEAGKHLRLGVIGTDQKIVGSPEGAGPQRKALPDQDLTRFQRELARILNPAMELAGGKPMPSSIFNALAMLNAYFEPFGLKEIMAQLLPRLKSHLDNSGIFFEKSLERIIAQVLDDKDGGSARNLADHAGIKDLFNRDLKPNLVLIQHFIEEKETLQKIFGPRTLALLKGAIAGLLSDITHQQSRAARQLESADPFQVFAFTLPLKEGKQSARLRVFYEKKQKAGSQNGFRISLLLSMDRLGDIRTDFLLMEKDLKINFYVTKAATMAKLQENFQKLTDLLGDSFDQIFLKINVSGKKVRDFDRPDIPPAGNQKINLRI